MKTILEKNYRISHNEDRFTQEYPFHSHDFYEIYFFAGGSVTYYIESQSYHLSKGDILIIPPRTLHRAVIDNTNASYDRYVLWLYNSCLAVNPGVKCFLEDIHQELSVKNTLLLNRNEQEADAFSDLLDRLLNCFSSEDDLAGYLAESCITLILNEIRSDLKSMDQVIELSDDLIHQVISYINDHLVDAPSLDELAAHFYVSKYYLLHQFKEYTKTTIHQYILMKRINLAKDYLESGFSPTSIYEKCGFSTYSNFYKAFTGQTGISPGNYKR